MKKTMKLALLVCLILLSCTLTFTACDISNGLQTPNGTTDCDATTEGDSTTDETTDSHVHAFGEWTTVKESTCTEKGEQERACACGEKETQSMDTIAHSFGEWVTTKEATCTEKGEQERACACGEKETQGVDVIDHPFGEWITVKDAKCKESGLSQRYCGVCKYTESQTIGELGHDPVKHEARAPICCLAGYEAYETCTRCDYVSDKKELPALEHSYDDKGFCTVCHDSELFKVFVCYDWESEYEVVIGYKSVDAFADMETLIIPAYHNGKRISHVGGDYSFAGMGVYTFRGLKNLKTLVLSEGIEFVQWAAFAECDQITSITIPKSMKKLDTTPFFISPKLQDVYYGGTKAEWQDMLKNPCIPMTVTVHCSDGDVVIEKATESTEGLAMRLKDDGTYECIGIGTCTYNSIIINTYNGIPVTSIKDCAFYCDENFLLRIPYVIYIVLGDSVIDIGRNALRENHLHEITLGNGLSHIGDGGFESCSNLTNIHFNGTVEQWKAIEKGSDWDVGTGNYTVYCTDGEITKN